MNQTQIAKAASETPWEFCRYDKDNLEIYGQKEIRIAILPNTQFGVNNAALIVTAVNEYDLLNQVAEAAKKVLSDYDSEANEGVAIYGAEELRESLIKLIQQRRKSGGE